MLGFWLLLFSMLILGASMYSAGGHAVDEMCASNAVHTLEVPDYRHSHLIYEHQCFEKLDS